jgi:agmatine deiminase
MQPGARLLSAGRAALDETEWITPVQMAHYLTQWGLLPRDLNAQAARRILENETPPPVVPTDDVKTRSARVRLPAQWEAMEAVIIAFPIWYPPLWQTHAAMMAAITPAARVDVLIPAPEWAGAIRLTLREREILWDHVRFLVIPTDDIWVRDYGPIVGCDANGTRVAVDAVYDPLETYPQTRDDSLPTRWASVDDMPVCALDLHIEGGNIWSDGAGTLIMTQEVLERHMPMTRDEIERALKGAFDFEKLILTPYLWREETRHIDLLCKLADARTILVGAPTPFKNAARLRATAELFRRESNAAGERYRVIELPMPAPYLNGLVYPVWRTYTNALTVNGRVLMPVFGVPQDQEALTIYQHAMPAHHIIPIPCAAAANGGGTVHCLTKEVPRGA